MLKLIAALIFLPSLFLFFISDTINHNSTSVLKPGPTKTPINRNEPANVENVILEYETINLWCPTAMSKAAKCSKEGMKIRVKTEAKDKENDLLVYDYKVSGGSIVGQGKQVVWDLFGAGIGEYTITVRVDDGCGFCGKNLSKTVKIVECDTCGEPPCVCPTIDVLGSKKTAYNGETLGFEAIISDGSQSEIDYNWKVEGGNILEGQATKTIKVQVLSNEAVTATVEIGGLCYGCSQVASETVKVVK